VQQGTLTELWLCERRKLKEWMATSDMDFCKNCVFIDEADFNLHMQRNYGRSRKGSPAKGIIPTARHVTITILGAISDAGVIDISLRKPQAISTSKKRRYMARQWMQLMAEWEPEQSITWLIYQTSWMYWTETICKATI
jgi:hypothetical protein